MRPAAVALGAIVVAAAAGVLVLRRRLVAVTVVGDSMEPALRSGDRVLVLRVPLRRVRRGQLVVVRPPPAPPGLDNPPWLVKRAAALPGDPLPAAVGALDDGTGRVPPGRFVLLGDNVERSYDSRRAGYFTAGALLGVVVRAPHRGT